MPSYKDTAQIMDMLMHIPQMCILVKIKTLRKFIIIFAGESTLQGFVIHWHHSYRIVQLYNHLPKKAKEGSHKHREQKNDGFVHLY